MQKNVLNTDLTGKVAVVTGAGGVLCSDMAKTLARAGAKVALLNRTLSKAQVHADAIVAEGGIAKAYQCNVLVENDCKVVAQQVLEDLGPCDILVNGAGGNSAKANTDKEFYEPGDIDDSTLQTFFTISPENVSSVLELNFLGTLLPTQVFAKQMLGRPGCCIVNISSMNAFTPLTKIPGKASGSTPSPRASSPRSRTPACCTTRTAAPPPAPRRSWPAPPPAAWAAPRSWRARCSSS